jgi:hypothetical protein
MHLSLGVYVILSLLVMMTPAEVLARASQSSSPASPPAQGGGGTQGRQSTPGRPGPRDAREQWPEGMIGTWLLNVEKSKFSGAPLKSAYRTFDYTADGQVLITWQMVSQEGNHRFGHWLVKLEGADGVGMERTRDTGSIPTNVAFVKQTDPETLEITAQRYGKTIWLGSFKVSPDGKTLYWKLKTTPEPGRTPSVTDWVYDKAQAQ